MKTIKVSGATPVQLDWAVATCEGYSVAVSESGEVIIIREGVVDYFDPHRNWGWGGPIIERENISVGYQGHLGVPLDSLWYATNRDDAGGLGPTPLIAAMRCFCCVKLGDTVEVPEELK